MKIAVFQNVQAGGAKRAAYSFTEELCRRNHSIDFFSLDCFDDRLFSLEALADNVYKHPFPPFKPFKNIRPYVLKALIDLVRRAIYFFRLNLAYQALANDIDARGYDVVFVHNCQYTQTPFLLRHLKTPSVYYANEPLRWVYEPTPKYEAEQPGLYKKLMGLLTLPMESLHKRMSLAIDRRNILSADFVFANSHFTRESVYRCYGIFSSVNSPGVDIKMFKPQDTDRKNFVLSIGAIAPLKQHNFVIESLGLVEESIRPKLIIIGNFSSERYVKFLVDRAKSLGVEVELKLLIEEEELVALYNEAKMVIYAPIMEPFGLVPLESMACATPVIGVKEGGIRETIVDEKTGVLIGRDTKECADAMTRLLSDAGLCKMLGQNGRKYVCQKWSWEKCADRLEKNLNDVASKEET